MLLVRTAYTGFCAGELLRQRARRRLRADRLRIHLGGRDRADDAVAVARRHHVDRARAGEHQALLDRLVAVAVEDDEIVLSHARLHDAAVRAGGSDHARVAAVRAEHPRRVLLAVGDRAGVVEQRAQHAALDAHVGAEQVLAHEVEERTPGGKLGERDAALVARRRPRVLAQPRVLGHRPRIGRQDLRLVAADGRHHAASDEVRRCPRAARRTRRPSRPLRSRCCPWRACGRRPGTRARPRGARAACAAARSPAHACSRRLRRGSS